MKVNAYAANAATINGISVAGTATTMLFRKALPIPDDRTSA